MSTCECSHARGLVRGRILGRRLRHPPISQVALACVGCLALGAGGMYLLDPHEGARRRSVAYGKITHMACHGRQTASKTLRYTAQRSTGIVARVKALLAKDHANDATIRDRVRSALGRLVSHPHAIETEVEQGVVILRGPILDAEVDHLIASIRHVRGVTDVLNRLDVYEDATAIPSLQGGLARGGRRWAVRQKSWDPATRLLVASAGTGLAIWGAIWRGWAGLAATAVGTGLMVRSFSNLPVRRLIGVGAGSRAVDVQKTINIHAPISRVFDFFADPTHFPHFMSNIREVRETDGRLHWVVSGPLATQVEWDAQITDRFPYKHLAWESIPGSMVENEGMMRFEENPDGGTRVDIKLSYNPPGGALGHVVAKAFGVDPKSEMDADLARVKTMLETGHPPRDAAQPVASAIASEQPGGDLPQLTRAGDIFMVQCSECGLQVKRTDAIFEEACPRCHAHAWQRFEPAGVEVNPTEPI